jgi:hypothetical protein
MSKFAADNKEIITKLFKAYDKAAGGAKGASKQQIVKATAVLKLKRPA